MVETIGTLEELREVRWNLEIETFDEFSTLMEEGVISWNNSLGELLYLIRFNDDQEKVIDSLEALSIDPATIFGSAYKLGQLSIQYLGFGPQSPASYLQNIDERQLVGFVNKWRKQSDPRWNPAYAPRGKLNQEIADFCKKNTPLKFVQKFNLECSSNDLLFPFNVWKLAEYLKLSYEK